MPIISFKDYVNLQHSTNEDTNQSVSCRMERSRETEPINFLVNDPKFFCGSGPNLFLQNSSIHNVHHELDVFGCERNDEMPLPMLSVSVSLCVLVHGYLSFCFNDVLEGMHLLALHTYSHLGWKLAHGDTHLQPRRHYLCRFQTLVSHCVSSFIFLCSVFRSFLI